MARITTAPPVKTSTASTLAAGPRETPDAPRGKPAGPAGPKGKPAAPRGVPGHPAERPTVRPPKPAPPPSTDKPASTASAKPARPIAGKLGKPGKDVKNPAPPNGPRIAAGPHEGPPGGRKPGATRSAAAGRGIGPAPRTVTGRAYHGLDAAFTYFNNALFSGRLPEVVLTLQRKKGSLGYHASNRFVDTAAERSGATPAAAGSRPAGAVDEIALNPTSFRDRSLIDVLSTLVHEMVHVAQAHFGKPSRSGYHNAEWAAAMTAIGLVPSDTGKPGGKTVGQHMDHYIEPGGKFDVACAAFLKSGAKVTLFGDLWTEDDLAKKPKTKQGVKSKYTCPVCGLNAWAKPEARISCTDCGEEMEGEDG
jgi:ribosomal protein L37AE/L43A